MLDEGQTQGGLLAHEATVNTQEALVQIKQRCPFVKRLDCHQICSLGHACHPWMWHLGAAAWYCGRLNIGLRTLSSRAPAKFT